MVGNDESDQAEWKKDLGQCQNHLKQICEDERFWHVQGQKVLVTDATTVLLPVFFRNAFM
jgi:hypothetical protein